jgi:hypothetical protein
LIIILFTVGIELKNMNKNNKNTELDNTDKKLHISDVIGSVNSLKLIGKKGKELWYPTYAPHILLGTNKSILTEIYLKHPDLRHYR